MRGYYGSLNHNVKATYVNYLGWFDGNPANLHAHPPEVAAKKYVEFMGGADAVLERARRAFDGGDYRWVAEVVNHVVFADPENADARALQADALEQLGYQSESGPWRNFYLTGAKELRDGVEQAPAPVAAAPDTIRAMGLDLFFDYLGVLVDGPRAAARDMALDFTFPDIDETHNVTVRNGALSHRRTSGNDDADAHVTIPRALLDRILLGETTLEEALASGDITVDGDVATFQAFVGLLDRFEFWFNIVTP
jgi:alkyl sulfatase BDS1-like metallo-beta-lactamase superfamily hydrolase